MFFNPRIEKKHKRILEIGPGGLPHPASDVWLDYDFDEEERVRQSGGVVVATQKPCVFYKGGRFPFRDRAFDYIIASHVIEHVPWDNLDLFVSEIKRVATAGYIEFPRWPYEIFFDFGPHVSTGDVIENQVVLYRKPDQRPNVSALRAVFAAFPAFQDFVGSQRNIFFCRYEWRDDIAYRLIENDYPGMKSPTEVERQFREELIRISQMNPSARCGSRFLNLTDRIKNKIYRTLGFGKRPPVDLVDLRPLLECPKTKTGISEDWSNQNNEKVFQVDGHNLTALF